MFFEMIDDRRQAAGLYIPFRCHLIYTFDHRPSHNLKWPCLIRGLMLLTLIDFLVSRRHLHVVS